MTLTPAHRRLGFAVIAMAALVTAATFIDEGEPAADPDPDETSSEERTGPEASPVIETGLAMTVIEEDPAAEQFALPEEPVLDVDDSEMNDAFIDSVSAVALAGDGVILASGPADHLCVLDIATGALRWELHGEENLPGEDRRAWAPDDTTRLADPQVVQGPDGWLILLAYTDLYFAAAGAPHEVGVAALSIEDGSVQWTAELAVNENDAEFILEVDDIEVSGGTVVAATGGVRADSLSEEVPEDALADVRTVALNGADGSVLWEAPGTSPAVAMDLPGLSPAVAGEVVYTKDARAAGAHVHATVTALDLATGSELWTFGEEDQYVSMGFAVAGAVMLHRHEEADFSSPVEASVLVEAETGATLATVDTSVGCIGDGGTRLACTFSDRGGSEPVTRLFTFDAADPHIGLAAHLLPIGVGRPESMLSGWILLSDIGKNFASDASGSAITTGVSILELPAVSEEYVVTAGSGDGSLLYDLRVYALA